MKFQLKVRKGFGEAELKDILFRGNFLQAGQVHQLSPDHPVEEMRSLYSVDVPDAVDAGALLKRLKREHAIEFVEPEVSRKLIKPIGR